jgi:hypothetical protein
MMLRSFTALLAAFAVLTVADAGFAGQSSSAGAYCSTNSDGSGGCSGSFNGFRAASDPQAYAALWNEGTAYAQFIAELNGSYYSCTTTAPGSAWFTISSGQPTTSFSISWNSAGTCTFVSMLAGSEFQ